MEKVSCNISVIIENSDILISDISESVIKINYSGDIDFTELVNSLIILIDKQVEVEYSIDDTIPDDNEKLKLVIDTLKEILDKYNENINSSEETVDKKEDGFLQSDTTENI